MLLYNLYLVLLCPGDVIYYFVFTLRRVIDKAVRQCWTRLHACVKA